ncbi:MAG: rod shape-determining protein MreD [Lentimicrobiaceae bacterium]|jgi:hypothetical protein|nr:rod shape-determining protein MreD [Lentimicrobiaceae bacterium]MBT3454311.1 rod shape-determining protein MreD [Lentimicrobiaceae bacterium]MBT3817965.1 rod shape-determining protein MreD [Lentimicrobiaceae bacterium]MBT4061529.1 rod shape-determining protein MreD [Lentimicrobiaceae bacterium]MBT4189819.1 rod shape-determining protein MreD [Lentimicrobiaceae bacterium]
MNNVVVLNIVRFLSLGLAQILIFNNMSLGSYINPSVYVLFIILLPARINGSLLLIVSFMAGLTMDYFTNSMGLHASVCVAIAFMRPSIISLFFRNYEFVSNEEVAPFSVGWQGFIKFSIVVVLLHQVLMFYLEVMSLNNFFFTLSKSLLSSAVTLIIIVIVMLIFGKRRRRI